MTEFIRKPATKMSLLKRMSVHGVGTNDAWYNTSYRDTNGKRAWCPYYRRWKHMIQRCYSAKFHKKHPTYSDCTVCPEWLRFSTFLEWMEQQDWEGKALDKDIIHPGNKVYSPENCRFISQSLNNLMTDQGATRGEYPIGVDWPKQKKKFRASCGVKGIQMLLGYFTDPDDAHMVYCKFKTLQIYAAAEEQTDPAIRAGLLLHATRVMFT